MALAASYSLDTTELRQSRAGVRRISVGTRDTVTWSSDFTFTNNEITATGITASDLVEIKLPEENVSWTATEGTAENGWVETYTFSLNFNGTDTDANALHAELKAGSATGYMIQWETYGAGTTETNVYWVGVKEADTCRYNGREQTVEQTMEVGGNTGVLTFTVKTFHGHFKANGVAYIVA